MLGADKIIAKARELAGDNQTAMALQFVDMALAMDLDEATLPQVRKLKGELLGVMGDNETSFIARNIFYNGHNTEMKLAGEDD